MFLVELRNEVKKTDLPGSLGAIFYHKTVVRFDQKLMLILPGSVEAD
jgi:hypothetical protein